MRKVLQKIPVFAWVLSLAATLMTGVWFGLPTIARNVKVDCTVSASGETAHCLRTKVVWLTVLQKKGGRQNLAPDVRKSPWIPAVAEEWPTPIFRFRNQNEGPGHVPGLSLSNFPPLSFHRRVHL